jgi:YbbR domain-containing protein
VHDAQIEPKDVTVVMSGSHDAMATFDADRINAFVNLSGIDEAHKLIRHVEVAIPPRFTILSINPPEVTITTSK